MTGPDTPDPGTALECRPVNRALVPTTPRLVKSSRPPAGEAMTLASNMELGVVSLATVVDGEWIGFDGTADRVLVARCLLPEPKEGLNLDDLTPADLDAALTRLLEPPGWPSVTLPTILGGGCVNPWGGWKLVGVIWLSPDDGARR